MEGVQIMHLYSINSNKREIAASIILVIYLTFIVIIFSIFNSEIIRSPVLKFKAISLMNDSINKNIVISFIVKSAF